MTHRDATSHRSIFSLAARLAALVLLAAIVFGLAAGGASAARRVDVTGDTVLIDDPTPEPTPTVPGQHHFTDGIVGTTTGTFSQGDPVSTEPGSFFMNAIGCPSGFNATSADIYELAFNCHDAAPLTTIWVGDGTNSTIYSNTAGVDVGIIAPGAKQIVYEIPTGYSAPRVFCNPNVLIDANPENEVSVTSNGIFYLTIDPGAWAYCDLMAIPTTQLSGATVSSDGNICDSTAVNGDFSHANLASVCATLSDMTITASITGQSFGQASTQNGVAVITGLPDGRVSLTASSPSPFDAQLVVYCNISEVGNDRRVDVQNDAIEIDVVDGETHNCSWFYVDNLTAGGPSASPASGTVVSDAGSAVLDPTVVADATSAPVTDDGSVEPVRIVSRSQDSAQDTSR